MSDAGGSSEKRRAGRAIRVPFVRLCHIAYAGGLMEDGFIVNINALGAYVARDAMPQLGRLVTIRFQEPGSEREIVAEGVVAWKNPVQEHRVHSLPPGFGIAFRALGEDARRRIDQIVSDYLSRQSGD